MNRDQLLRAAVH